MYEDMGGGSIRGHYFFLYQALSNLLQNAADFSREGGVIHVAAAESRRVVQLTIEDNGTGIPDYAVGKIFTSPR